MANKKKLTTEAIIELTLRRFAPLKVGKPPEALADLAKAFDISEKTAQSAIGEAFRNNLVVLNKVEIPPSYTELPHLEERIRDKFPALRMATVIGVASGTNNYEMVHRALGHALASRIHNSVMGFHSGDIIGVGTGRSVHYTVKALSTFPPIKVDNITVMSLTGSFFMLTNKTSSLSEAMNHAIDADSNTDLLLKYFQGPIQVRRVSFPIAVPPSVSRLEIMKSTWLDADEYQRHTPKHAIIGLGMFSEENGLIQTARRSQDSGFTSPALGPISLRLRELIAALDIIRQRHSGYCPVGDICNHLFIVPPHEDLVLDRDSKNLMDIIKRNVDAINSMLLTADEAQLCRIQNVMLVAGTMPKAAGIRYVLNKGRVRVHGLCVDEGVARYLLAES